MKSSRSRSEMIFSLRSRQLSTRCMHALLFTRMRKERGNRVTHRIVCAVRNLQDTCQDAAVPVGPPERVVARLQERHEWLESITEPNKSDDHDDSACTIISQLQSVPICPLEPQTPLLLQVPFLYECMCMHTRTRTHARTHTHTHTHMHTHAHTHMHVHTHVCLSVCLPVCLSACLSVYACTYVCTLCLVTCRAHTGQS